MPTGQEVWNEMRAKLRPEMIAALEQVAGNRQELRRLISAFDDTFLLTNASEKDVDKEIDAVTRWQYFLGVMQTLVTMAAVFRTGIPPSQVQKVLAGVDASNAKLAGQLSATFTRIVESQERERKQGK